MSKRSQRWLIGDIEPPGAFASDDGPMTRPLARYEVVREEVSVELIVRMLAGRPTDTVSIHAAVRERHPHSTITRTQVERVMIDLGFNE